MTKIFLCCVLIAFSVNAEEYNQKEVDSYELLLKMSEEENSLFAKEISQLKESLKGTSLHVITKGVLAYRAGKAEEGAGLFFSIKEGNPYFELMFHAFSRAISDYPGTTKGIYDRLARLAFETSLRDIQELETGCVIGLLSHYKKLVENEPVKKAEFDKWLTKKWQVFYAAEPGNWYKVLYHESEIHVPRLQEVTEPLEAVLLGFQKPGESFNELWKKLHSQRPNFLNRVEDQAWSAQISYFQITAYLEELRLHVLAGRVSSSEKEFELLRIYIHQLAKFYIETKETKETKANLEELFSKYFYIKGVHQYLLARNKMLKDEDVREDIIGRKGVAVSLYLAGLKGGDSIWVKKAQKLYEHIQSHTEEWFSKEIKNYTITK